MKKFLQATLILSTLIFGGCAASESGYTQSDVGQVKSYKRGTVREVRNITIDDDYKGVAAGAVIGGIAGSAFGKGDGKVATAAAGAILGGLAGSHLNKDAGQELTIEYDNGDTITTVYRIDKDSPFMFRSGDRVVVETVDGKVKSIKLAK